MAVIFYSLLPLLFLENRWDGQLAYEPLQALVLVLELTARVSVPEGSGEAELPSLEELLLPLVERVGYDALLPAELRYRD